MEAKKAFDLYLDTVKEENRNLVTIAYDEMKSNQYEEAASHFDKLYTMDASDYMSYFFRAYCKSYCGRRGDVYPDAQTLSSAFTSALKKAIEDEDTLETNMTLLINHYFEAMGNLAYNAVGEVSSNGVRTNHTRDRINRMASQVLYDLATKNKDAIKGNNGVKGSVILWLKKYERIDLKRLGALIVFYEPEYASTYKRKRIMKIVKVLLSVGIPIAIFIVIVVAIINAI